MLITMLKGKIHRAVITDKKLHYEGSITIDPVLYEAAKMRPYEQVQVLNVNNGARFETYVIEGERGSGAVCLNGAAARLGEPGDHVIILAYAQMTPEEAATHHPAVVCVDAWNRPTA